VLVLAFRRIGFRRNGTEPTLQYRRPLTNCGVNTSHDAPRRPLRVRCITGKWHNPQCSLKTSQIVSNATTMRICFI